MSMKRRPLKIRQGITAGVIVLAVLSVTISVRSAAPLASFVEIVVFGSMMLALAILAVIAIDRRRAR